MRIAITGSNGFIGSELTQRFIDAGHEVLLLQRRPPKINLPNRAHFIPYDLNSCSVPDLPETDALIHCAYLPHKPGIKSSEINISGTMALYKYCRNKNISFVFLSSLSAHEQALSEYGKHKFTIEQMLDARHCLILKLGLVIGKKGLFARIRSSLKRSPFLFLVGGGLQPVQPLMVEDVAQVIAHCLQQRIFGTYHIATPAVYTVKDLFRMLANSLGRKPVFIPIPYWVAQAGIRLVELLRLPFPVSNENLLGLKQLRSFDTKPDLQRLGITLQKINP